MADYEPIKECIACGGTDLKLVFDLGWQPLANAYKKRRYSPEDSYPLAINSCNHCKHVQLTYKVRPDLLFQDYAYVSGVSKTSLKFFEWFADMSLEYFPTKPWSVLDIGCNDGSQLDFYQKLGMDTWGVDPAQTLYEISSRRHQVVCDFFKPGLLKKQFDIVTVQNAFAHNTDQLALLQNIRPLLKTSSVLFAVTSHAHMLLNGEFDTIYHEHLSFYNIQSMRCLCERAGLYLTDVRRHPIHGGSYIFVIEPKPRNPDRVQHLIELEQGQGLYTDGILSEFRAKALATVAKTIDFVKDCRVNKIPVVGYGAPAKSCVFLNYAGLRMDWIVEDTPLKQGKFTPGMDIPILDPTSISKLENTPQVCWVILAWNFYEEIVAKIQAHRPNNQDIFVRYLPEFRVEYK